VPSNGGGSLRVVLAAIDGALDAIDEDRVTLEDEGMLSTLTQSGSSLGVNGFAGRAAFGMAPLNGGLRSDDAGWPDRDKSERSGHEGSRIYHYLTTICADQNSQEASQTEQARSRASHLRRQG
jgi:hypothetical protein